MKTAVILPAAGLSRRFQQDDGKPASKLETNLEDKPVFLHAVERFADRRDVGAVILAVQPDRLDAFKLRWGDRLSFRGVTLVAGGEVDRWQTVQRAIEAVPDDCTHIAVHDAARPLVSDDVIDRVFAAAEKFDAVIPAVPVSGTLKRVTEPQQADDDSDDPLDAILGSAGKPAVVTRRVTETVDRSNLVEVQTPQVFKADLLRKVYAELIDGAGITDDAGLIEAAGGEVHVVDGDPGNLKITRPADMDLAKAILAYRSRDANAELGRKRLFGDDDDE